MVVVQSFLEGALNWLQEDAEFVCGRGTGVWLRSVAFHTEGPTSASVEGGSVEGG
jgi:hypothetical protein